MPDETYSNGVYMIHVDKNNLNSSTQQPKPSAPGGSRADKRLVTAGCTEERRCTWRVSPRHISCMHLMPWMASNRGKGAAVPCGVCDASFHPEHRRCGLRMAVVDTTGTRKAAEPATTADSSPTTIRHRSCSTLTDTRASAFWAQKFRQQKLGEFTPQAQKKP